MSDHVVLFITAPSDDVATTLANALVGEGLAACVNRIPGVRSTYRWEGKMEVADEVLLLVKTRSASFEAVRARVLELHPYTVPEIIALPIVAGHAPYLAWIDESTKPNA